MLNFIYSDYVVPSLVRTDTRTRLISCFPLKNVKFDCHTFFKQMFLKTFIIVSPSFHDTLVVSVVFGIQLITVSSLWEIDHFRRNGPRIVIGLIWPLTRSPWVNIIVTDRISLSVGQWHPRSVYKTEIGFFVYVTRINLHSTTSGSRFNFSRQIPSHSFANSFI